MEVSGQLHAPVTLLSGKELFEYEIRWDPEPVWTTWARENSWPYRDLNSDSSVVQPVASRYTDYWNSAVIKDIGLELSGEMCLSALAGMQDKIIMWPL
jgi:hypothetical protein